MMTILKKNKIKLILSSIIILIPILLGCIMWDKLPNTLITHWGFDGTADGFSEKAFAIFGLPIILMLIHFICLIFTLSTNKENNQSSKAFDMVFWIIPITSIFASIVMYETALGKELNLFLLVNIFLGIIFISLGNYLPKVKQNSTIGIKVSWTLNNEDNWNKTHRFGGKLWVIGGILIIFTALFPIRLATWITLFIILAISFIPIVYSYIIYRNHQSKGIKYNSSQQTKVEKITVKISTAIVAIILIGTLILLFTGDIKIDFNDTSFKIDTTYWHDLEVNYSQIDKIEYRENLDAGVRTYGFGSARLSLGTFKNNEFGTYTLYAYTNAKEYLVLTTSNKTLVIGMRNSKDTQAIYEIMSKAIENSNK